MPWMSHLWFRYSKWFFKHAIVLIDAKDRAFVPVPGRLEFLYHIIRPTRLVGKHSGRLAGLAFSKATDWQRRISP